MSLPADLAVNGRRANEVEVRLSCGEECQVGILEQSSTKIKWGPTTTNNIAKFRGLRKESNYTVFARRRYATRVWFKGEFLFGEVASLEVETCPDNMEGFPEIQSATCIAMNGFFKNAQGKAESCKLLSSSLPFGALDDVCTQPSYTVQNLSISPGFWRPVLSSAEILKCPKSEYCLGTETAQDGTPDQYCTENHTGIYCSDCIEGFKLTSDGCIMCDEIAKEDSMRGLAIIILLYIALELALCGYVILSASNTPLTCLRRFFASLQGCQSKLCKPCKKKANNKGRKRSRLSICISVLRSAPKHIHVNTKTRILLGYLQVLFSFQRGFRQNTDIFKFEVISLLEFFSSLSVFAIFNSFGARCTFHVDHYVELLARTLAPLAMLSVLVFLVWMLTRDPCQAHIPVAPDKIIQSLTTAVLFLLFLVYPSVSETIFATFWCEDFGETAGNMTSSALIADYRLSCVSEDDQDRIGYVVYAAVMVIVYPLGILVLYTALLWRFHQSDGERSGDPQMYTDTKRESGTASEDSRLKISRAMGANAISFLTKPYSEKYFWFESYELLRKLCMTSLLSALQSTELARGTRRVTLPLIAQNVVFLFCLILMRLQPYKLKADFAFAVVSLCMLLPATQFSVLEPLGGGRLSDIGSALLVYIELGLFVTFVVGESLVLSIKGSRIDPAVHTPPVRSSGQAQQQSFRPEEDSEVRSSQREETRVPVVS